MIVDGIIFSFGMFLSDMSNDFNVSKAEVTLVGSLLSGFYLMAGPFVSALANKYGFRLVAILGSIIGCIAFVLSAFSTSVEFLFISYGVLGGIGFGLIYVPAVITVGFYFEKWRALATGIAVCGSGIGTFLLAPVSSFLVEEFGWRYALLIQAALVLTCGIFGALFRPIQPVKLSIESTLNSEASFETKSKPLINNITLLALQENSESVNSLGSMISLNSKTVPVRSNYNYPTAKDVLGLNDRRVLQHPQVAMLSKSEKKLNSPVILENVKLEDQMECRPKGEDEPLITVGSFKNPLERRHTMGEKYFNKDVYRKTTTPKPEEGVQRPFYRDDIFFSASLQRLNQYTSHTSLGYHLSVTRLPTKIDLIEEKEAKCKLCPESITRILNTMLDLSLLKSPSFLLLAFSGFFTMMGFYVPFMYLMDRALLDGMEMGTAMWLVSTIGITNTIGRVVCGVLTSFPGCDALLINNIAITIAGLATLCSNIIDHDYYQFAYAGLFGLSICKYFLKYDFRFNYLRKIWVSIF